MKIRLETGDDGPAVRRVIAAAFGREAEADLVAALRSAGDAALSLVAEGRGTIIGHVLFSKLRAPEGCLALAPVAVTPDRQRRGVGAALIIEGLARVKRDGWQAVFVLGEPAYYGRFGFQTTAADGFETEYPRPYIMAVELAPGGLTGRRGAVVYAPAFLALD